MFLQSAQSHPFKRLFKKNFVLAVTAAGQPGFCVVTLHASCTQQQGLPTQRCPTHQLHAAAAGPTQRPCCSLCSAAAGEPQPGPDEHQQILSNSTALLLQVLSRQAQPISAEEGRSQQGGACQWPGGPSTPTASHGPQPGQAAPLCKCRAPRASCRPPPRLSPERQAPPATPRLRRGKCVGAKAKDVLKRSRRRLGGG